MQSIEGVNGQNKSQSDDPCVLPSRSRSGSSETRVFTGSHCDRGHRENVFVLHGCLCLVSMLLGRYRSGRRRRSAVSCWTPPQVWSHQQPPPMTYTSAARFEEAKQMQMLSLVRVSNHSAIFSSWLTTSAGVSHISIWLRG